MRKNVRNTIPYQYCVIIITFILTAGLIYHFEGGRQKNVAAAYAPDSCTGEFISVSLPLNELGSSEYVRLDEGPTGFSGGLYPNGSNTRPAVHEAAGVGLANQIVPLNAAGQPDSVNGKIVMLSIGMSNTSHEFDFFINDAENDTAVNPQLVIVNGAQAGQAASKWVDPNAEPWNRADGFLSDKNVTPAQVQVAWVKLAKFGPGAFPQFATRLQNDLVVITQNLKARYPNVKITYLSSRTRAYLYWAGLSPEPVAFETGFAVKWLIEDQINGDPALNYDPAQGNVLVPYFSWGPYLWADGLNPRSDGLIWTQDDVLDDCIHPSDSGRQKVADLLMAFFKSDTTTQPWFLADPDNPLPTPTETVTPTATHTPDPGVTPSPQPTASVTLVPSPSPTASPTALPAPSFNHFLPIIWGKGGS